MTSSNPADEEIQQAIAELHAGQAAESNSRLLVMRFYPWVRRFFIQRGYEPQESEDLAQETLCRAFRQVGTFQQGGSFESWLFAVATNLHRNELRRRRQERRNAPEVALEGPEAGRLAREIEAPEASPPQAAYERERREALARAVRTLPPQVHQVLALRVDQDLKYREIATLLQISVETVKAHLFQARQRLRAELGEEYGDWQG